MQAARAAMRADESDRRVVVHHLLSSLVHQVSGGPNGSPSKPGPEPPDP